MKDKDQLTDEIIVLTDYFMHSNALAAAAAKVSADACLAAATAVILHLDSRSVPIGEEDDD